MRWGHPNRRQVLSRPTRWAPPTSSGGSAAAFTPATISGLMSWWRGDLGTFQDDARTTPATVDGDPVGGWADQSGNAYHASQATASKRFTLKQVTNNGQTFWVVRGDGVDDHLVAATVPNTAQPFTWAASVKPVTTADYRNIIGSGAAAPNNVQLYKHPTDVAGMYANTEVTAGAIAGGWHVIDAVFNGASSSLVVDGTTTSTDNPGAAGFQSGLVIGAVYTLTEQLWKDDIHEIVCVTGALSADQRAQLRSYMAARVGVTVA